MRRGIRGRGRERMKRGRRGGGRGEDEGDVKKVEAG